MARMLWQESLNVLSYFLLWQESLNVLSACFPLHSHPSSIAKFDVTMLDIIFLIAMMILPREKM